MANKKSTGTHRRKSRKRSSGFGYHRRSAALITMILVLLGCVLTVNAVTLQAKNKSYKQQEAELKAQIKRAERARRRDKRIRRVC